MLQLLFFLFFICTAVMYCIHCSMSATESDETLLACRYAVIVHPMKSRSWCSIGRTKKIICGIWVASVLLSAPLLHFMVSPRASRRPSSSSAIKVIQCVMYTRLWRLFCTLMVHIIVFIIYYVSVHSPIQRSSFYY